ncbi:MAG: hypothetical protein OEM01_04335 [Desulfobulbaceae bacterium]|nr:hypothetical protein [Desulfobulbaceae bacterium]
MEKKEDGRRSFLKHVLAGTAIVAGVAATKKTANAKKNLQAGYGDSETLYRETEEFKKYYESIRS